MLITKTKRGGAEGKKNGCVIVIHLSITVLLCGARSLCRTGDLLNSDNEQTNRVSVQLAAGKEGDRWSMNGAMRRARLCPPACLPVLHHPPDRKVMHEPTEPKCSGESASSHPESIRCLNKAGERSLLLETASLFLASQDCTPDLQVAPGTEDPTLASIILAARTLSPSFSFGC